MSTRTPVYNLYQWEGSDPVSRTEMNQNFLALEQAVDAIRTYNLIAQAQVNSAQTSFSISTSGWNWSKWHEIVIECNSPSEVVCDVHVNGMTTSNDNHSEGALYYATSQSGSLSALGRLDLREGRVSLFPAQRSDGRLYVQCQSNPYNTVGYSNSYKWSQVTSMNFNVAYSGSIPAGTTFKVWGIR